MEEERMAPQGSSKRTLSAEPPAVAAPAPPLGDVFDDDLSRFDGDLSRFDGAVLGLPASDGGEEEELADELSEDDEDAEGYENDDDDGGSNTESEFEEYDDAKLKFWDGEAAGTVTNDDLAAEAALMTFLGRLTRFASVQNTAGFMRLAAAEAPLGQDGGGGVIVVHFRYTRFWRPRSGGRGGGDGVVEVRSFGSNLHHLRYLVPFPAAAADPASSLRLAGAALASDAYPAGSYVQLQALWSSLVAVAPLRVPPRVARLVVTVDVGILRNEDCTPERMASMRSALAVLAREADASPISCGREMHLPAPVRCDESGEVARPEKRRRLAVAGEECGICYEVLERGLAAWPRCSHVFHARCFEQLLVTMKHRCPMCRSALSIKGMFD